MHESRFRVFSAPRTRDRKGNLRLRSGRSECVCEVRTHRQNMKQEWVFVLLCTFLLCREHETRAYSRVTVRTSRSSLVLRCLPHSLLAIFILSQLSLGKPSSWVCSSLTCAVVPRSAWQLAYAWQFQLQTRSFAHLPWLLSLCSVGRGCQRV